ncbi:TolB family protein [Hyphobacterium sp.]|jgi:Tol biopolymer transport system component|uniref:TolB family protein n=1 Tax=Hyphobacterium sp. TaxID=2004662 RepID=UPI003BAC0E67
MRALFLSASALLALSACSASDDIAPADAGEEAAGADTAEEASTADDAQDNAAGLPANDIAVAELTWIDGQPVLGTPEVVTARSNYDNQPAFDSSGGFYFTTETSGANTDIHYRSANGDIRVITRTPDESEYSPRPSPDGRSVTYIHQPPGQVGGQAWRQRLEGGSTAPIHDYGPAGYYALSGDQSQLLLFALTDPFTLLWVDIENGRRAEITTGIGRALYTSPDGNSAYFTLPQSDGSWTVNRFGFAGQTVSELFALPGETQDYAVFTTPEGELGWFTAADGQLLFRTSDNAEWTAVADLSPLGSGAVTRLAVSPSADRMAFVVEEAG